MKSILILFFCLFSFDSFAKIIAQVIDYRGTVLYEGRQVGKGDTLGKDGLIEVKEKSYLRVKVEKYNALMSFRAGTKVKLKFDKEKKNRSPFTILDGMLRFRTLGKAEKRGLVKTPRAALAVRGTDFLIIESQLLGESEVYMFEGSAVFANRKNTKDRATVRVNDWGGIGGRFGKGVGDAVPMTDDQIAYVKKLVE